MVQTVNELKIKNDNLKIKSKNNSPQRNANFSFFQKLFSFVEDKSNDTKFLKVFH